MGCIRVGCIRKWGYILGMHNPRMLPLRVGKCIRLRVRISSDRVASSISNLVITSNPGNRVGIPVTTWDFDSR